MKQQNDGKDLSKMLQSVVHRLQLIEWRQSQILNRAEHQRRQEQRHKSGELEKGFNETLKRGAVITGKQPTPVTDKTPLQSTTGGQPRVTDPLRQSVNRAIEQVDDGTHMMPAVRPSAYHLDWAAVHPLPKSETPQDNRDAALLETMRMPAIVSPAQPTTQPRQRITLVPIARVAPPAQQAGRLPQRAAPVTPLPVQRPGVEIVESPGPQRRIDYRIAEKASLRERLLAASLYYCCKYERRPDAILMSRGNYEFVLPILRCQSAYEFGYPLDDKGEITIPYGIDDKLDDKTIACIGSPQSTNKLPEQR